MSGFVCSKFYIDTDNYKSKNLKIKLSERIQNELLFTLFFFFFFLFFLFFFSGFFLFFFLHFFLSFLFFSLFVVFIYIFAGIIALIGILTFFADRSIRFIFITSTMISFRSIFTDIRFIAAACTKN